MQRRMQSLEGWAETRAPLRWEYILWSFSRLLSSASWLDSEGGGDRVTSTARVKLATSGHIRVHRVLQNSLRITARGKVNNWKSELSNQPRGIF